MAQAISLNSLDMQSASIITSKFVHEGMSIDQAKMKIPHRSGEKITSYTYASRPIQLEGVLIGTSAADLDSKVDAFKLALIGAMAVNLDYGYNGGTRRYVVNVTQVAIAREAYNINSVPFVVECEAINPPFGMDTSVSQGYALAPVTGGSYDAGVGGYVKTNSVTILGTANAQPQIKLTLDTKGTFSGFTFTNTTTNQSITVSPAVITAGDVFIVDCKNFTVTQNGVVILTYTGIFPDFQPGANAFILTTYEASHASSVDLEINYTKYYL